MEDLELLKYIKSHLPTHSRLDEGLNFNLTKIHLILEEHLNGKKQT